MSLSAHKPTQQIIRRVRTHLLLENAHKQFLKGLLIAAAIFPVLACVHVFFIAIPLRFAIGLAFIPTALLISYSFVFCLPSTEDICKRADRLFNSQSIILTAWTMTHSSSTSEGRSVNLLQESVAQSLPKWKRILRRQPLFNFSAYHLVLVTCMFFGILPLLLHPGIQANSAGIAVDHGAALILTASNKNTQIADREDFAKEFRSLLQNKTQVTAVNKNHFPSATANQQTKHKTNDDEQRPIKSMMSALSKQALHGKNLPTHIQSDDPGKTALNKQASRNAAGNRPAPNRRNNHFDNAVPGVSKVPIELNDKNTISAVSSSEHSSPFSESGPDMSGSLNTVNNIDPDLNQAAAAAHYQAEFSPAMKAYITNYRKNMGTIQ